VSPQAVIIDAALRTVTLASDLNSIFDAAASERRVM
jgi:hypothetical protein